MSTVHFPGGRVDEFVTDFVMEGKRIGENDRRRLDGRVYVGDGRSGSEWAARNEGAKRFIAYARPTDLLKEAFGSNIGSIELIQWAPSAEYPDGAVLLIARRPDHPYLFEGYMCLEIPNYTGFRKGDEVLAKWWDHKEYPALIVGLNIGDRVPTYRAYFEHADKGEGHGAYIDVKPEDIKKRE